MIHTQGAKRSVPSHPHPPFSECRPQVLHPLPEDSKDRACHHSDYAHNPSQNPNKLSRLDLELRMLRERDTDKVKRSENKVCILFYSYPIPPSRFCLLLALSRAFFPRRIRFPAASSDVQPSSMVSFAGVVWLRVQRPKSVVHALPMRSRRWQSHCKAPSPSQTAVIPCKTMVQRSLLRPSNTAGSSRRQGRCPRPQSLKNTSTKNYLNSLQMPRRRLPSLS